MKRTRTIILAGVLIAALFVAVLPAFAVAELIAINYSFMGDQNNDNIPDKWNVVGDAFRNCTVNYLTDACGMIFPPSASKAIVWQQLPADIAVEALSEEPTVTTGLSILGAKQFDWGRGYVGMRAVGDDNSVVTVYDSVNGGTYPFNFFQFTDTVGGWIEGFESDNVKIGIVVLPGDGYLAVDYLYPPFTPGP